MAKHVEVTAIALDEAIAARLWYAKRDESAVRNFEAEFEIALKRVGELPLSFPIYLLGTRRCLFHSFPYMLVFVDLPDVVRVISVADGRRKPGYWRRRLP